MGLLPLLVLAVLALEPGAASGAETVGNSSEGLYSQHMEAPKLGVESELQLLATATATAHHQIRAASSTYIEALSNGSLTH